MTPFRAPFCELYSWSRRTAKCVAKGLSLHSWTGLPSDAPLSRLSIAAQVRAGSRGLRKQINVGLEEAMINDL
jgi:hypothetical protein